MNQDFKIGDLIKSHNSGRIYKVIDRKLKFGLFFPMVMLSFGPATISEYTVLDSKVNFKSHRLTKIFQ